MGKQKLLDLLSIILSPYLAVLLKLFKTVLLAFRPSGGQLSINRRLEKLSSGFKNKVQVRFRILRFKQVKSIMSRHGQPLRQPLCQMS